MVNFSAKIGYTDGSGAVVLLTQVGSTLPKTVLYPYVDNFQFTVYAGGNPAAGAVVTLDGNDNEYSYRTDNDTSDYYQTGYKTFTADANGVVTITAADKVPANGWYGAFVAPYDADGDGQFEYDATRSSTIFNLSANRQDTDSMLHYDSTGTLVQTENAPTINLADSSSDISVVYNSLQGNDTIPVAQAADFSITVMLNRPVTEEMLAGWPGPLFTLRANNGSMPVPFTVTNVGGYLYTITPDITLDPTRNYYRLSVNDAISFSADWDGVNSTQYADNAISFVIYDPNATLSGAIVPGLDIEENTTYKVDWNRFLVGDMTTDNALSTDLTQGSRYGDDLKLSFMADPTATGYQVWVKDSNSPWINVEQSGSYLSYTYNDGQAIELTVNNLFYSNFAGGELVNHTPLNEVLLAGNTLQVVVMPENINGFAIDPNTDNTIAGLSLTDNWGPEIVSTGFTGLTTQFTAGTDCDETARNIAVGEPLMSATLTPEYTDPATELGARATAGSSCFTVAAVRFPDNDLVTPGTDAPYPSNFSYIQVDLAPAVATTSTADALAGDTIIPVADNAGFAYDDRVRVGTQDERVRGFIGSDQLIVTPLGGDEASGSEVYWRGPVQEGYTDVSANIFYSPDVANLMIAVTDNTGVDTTGNGKLNSGEEVTNSGSGYLASGSDFIEIDAPLAVNVAPGAAIAGYNNLGGTGAFCDTTLAANATGTTSIDITDGLNCQDGDLLVLDYGETYGIPLLYSIVSGADGTTGPKTIVVSSNVPAALLAGTTVQERENWTVTAVIGYPQVNLNFAAYVGIQPGSTLTFTEGNDTFTANIVAMDLTHVVLDDIPTRAGTPWGFTSAADYTINSARGADSLQVLVQDRSGNNSDNTDTDGDGNADFDQIGYEEVGGMWGVF